MAQGARRREIKINIESRHNGKPRVNYELSARHHAHRSLDEDGSSEPVKEAKADEL